jgi:hypothetical protein
VRLSVALTDTEAVDRPSTPKMPTCQPLSEGLSPPALPACARCASRSPARAARLSNGADPGGARATQPARRAPGSFARRSRSASSGTGAQAGCAQMILGQTRTTSPGGLSIRLQLQLAGAPRAAAPSSSPGKREGPVETGPRILRRFQIRLRTSPTRMRTGTRLTGGSSPRAPRVHRPTRGGLRRAPDYRAHRAGVVPTMRRKCRLKRL